MTTTKKNIALIFGGPSTEHEVSIVSAMNVSKAMDNELFEKTLIGISKEGHWYQIQSDDDFSKIKVIDQEHVLPSFEPITLIREKSKVYILNLKSFKKSVLDASLSCTTRSLRRRWVRSRFF
jgi:D-alanine-D-alanine ligase-like ATP-grasp enzyme